jgi:hypothetical protein
MGSFARGSRFPETLRREAAVNPKNFFAELKRRNVYEVVVAYVIVAWARRRYCQAVGMPRAVRAIGRANGS